MSPEHRTRPQARTFDVETLVKLAWAGQVRVPDFQRPFRWKREDVRRLLDSIVRGYPVGSLLLWTRRAPEGLITLGAVHIEAPALDEALWVVDGQQRIMSLASVLHPSGQSDERFALAYDLRNQQFVPTPLVQDPLIVPLPTLFDLEALLAWFAGNPAVSSYVNDASAITRAIRQFQIPASQVSDDDPKVLQDIFDRMNNYGKRLSRAEVFSALNAQEIVGQLTIETIIQSIDESLRFGAIDDNVVLQAVLARRDPAVKRDVRGEFDRPDDEGRDAAFSAGEQALRRVVEFLQGECHVPHFTFVAYSYLLVPLARLFAHHPAPDPRNRRLLRRWYWRAAVAGPQQFKAGTGDAARLLSARVSSDSLAASVQGLLDLVHQSSPQLPDLQRFATNQAATKIVLCSWWSRGPRSPETTDPFDISDLAEALADQDTARDAVRYLVSNRRVQRPQRQFAANRVLIPRLTVDSAEVEGLMAQRRSDPPWMAMLDSHSMSVDLADLLRSGKSETALESRQQLLTTRTQDFLREMCEWDFEDTPPLATLLIEDDIDDDDSLF